MKLRPRVKAATEIPTSSMADIAFLLIVFFMVTTTFAVGRGIDFTFPRALDPADGPAQPLESVHILIEGSGRLMVDGSAMSLGDIQYYLYPKLALNPGKHVIVQTDPDALYGDMIDVLDELQQAEVANIVIPSRHQVDTWAGLVDPTS